MEGGVCDAPVLYASTSVELAFAAMDPPQRVHGVVESQKLDNGAFPSNEGRPVGL
jgi:hypothetical protein